ncbi:chondroitin sulfate proteoglycan 4 [Anguilla anguilla]|uniref:chondroitin sulfate proteoglycan 4 n=1 Tax=Anguilla anguilla TaxID=7936 RepID=UPI0015AEFB02|nr:chondroitin sulfate proteoglycan 4 [Anguilla anguilla]
MEMYLKRIRWIFWNGLALLLLSRLTLGASFYGDGFVHLKTMTSSTHTSLHIQFRTPSSNGLLFLAAGQTDYLLVELLCGLLQVTLELGSGKQVLHSERGGPLNDMAWHSVTLHHEHHDVTLIVDNRSQSSLTMPGSEKELIVEDGLFLGGPGSLVKPYLLRNLTGFRGCIDEALFNEHSLLSSLRPCPGFRDVHEVHPGCSTQFSAATEDPVGFLSSRAYMALPPWNTQPEGRFECLVHTSTQEGIILYSSAYQGGFVALEMHEGMLVAIVGKGQTQNQLRSLSLLNDGQWHSVRLHFTTRSINLKVDTETVQASIDSPSQPLHLSGPLYVGGVDDVIHMDVRKMGLVSGSSRHARGDSFKGCLKNITVNAVRMGLPSAMVTKDIFAGCELEKETETNIARTQRTVKGALTPSVSPAQPVHTSTLIEDLQKRYVQNLILMDLVVTEGGYAILELKHLKVNLDYLDIEASQVKFRIKEQPVHGRLILDVDQDQEENTFSLLDLQQKRVLYIHGGSEDPLDFFMFSVFANSEREVYNYLNENITYRYNITVTPTNDAPELSLPDGNLFVLLENSKKLLTPDVLKATDIDSNSADLVFSVVGRPDADSGFLEVDVNPGKAVTAFSHSDLEDGKVRYVHTGVRNSKVAFRVSDGDKESNTVVLRIMAIRLEYKIANNTGLEVTQGSMALIGSRHLAVQTNAINQTVEIRYDVIEPPQYGELQRLHSSGEWKPVSTFSQRLLEKERLKYLSTFHEIQTGNITDHFKCKVKVGPRDTEELVFPVVVRWIQYKLIRKEILEVNKMRRVILDSQHLHVITQGVQLSESEIHFRLKTSPKKGNLLLNNMILKKNSSFSQRNVTDLKVQYELVDQPRIDTQDVFTFQVFSKHARSGNYDFRIAIKVDMDTIFLDNNGLSVIEGGSKRVTKDALYSETLGTKAVYYTIKDGPRHGKLVFSNSTLGKSSVIAFTNQDILEERIIYIHDGSETMHDRFTFVTSINQISEPILNWSSRAVEGAFNISVQPVNDEKPVRVVNKVFHVVREGQRLLTLDDLCFHDPDSDFNDEQLVYTRRVVPMGELVMVNDTSRKLYMFLQKDLKQKQVLFVHRGVSSGRFVLFVSDGKHHSSTLLDVRAHDPYLNIDNRTDLLVQKGQASVFSSSKFSVDTNMDVRDDGEMSYKMVVPPQHGGLYRGNTIVDSFTQQDLKMGHLFYRHDGSSNLEDSFSFTVRVKEIRLNAGVNVRVYLRSQQGPLKVMRNETLLVEEGKSVTINKTTLEVAHEDSLSLEIVYTVKNPPAHGYLWRFAKGGSGDSGTEKTAVRSFSQTDVNSGIIRYVQMEPGQAWDAFELDATNGVTQVSDIHMFVDIVPRYIPLWVSSVTVQEGASKTLSEEVIKVPDRRFSAPNLLFTVSSPPQQGRIEHSYFPGIPIITFTRKQVEQELIHYVHEGSGALEDSFTVIASDVELRKESLPQTVHVWVAAGKSNAPVITANRILRVWEGSVREIGPRDLCAWDKDTPPEGLYYTITPPTNGHLALKSAPARQIFNFTQALIDQSQLLFVHNGVTAGGFNFQVNDGVNFAPPQTFSVVATPLVVRLERNRPLRVIPGSTTPIHREDLLAVTNDNDTKENRTILFNVTSPPKLGELVNVGSDSTAEISSFTQKMVNEGTVAYKHKRQRHVEGSASDAFTFTVSSPPASLEALVFHIHISPSAGPEGKGLLHLNTGAVVTEGGRVVIDKSKLDASNLLDRLPEAWQHAYEIWYRVTSLPKHGVIMVGWENLTNQNPTFSQSILNEEGIAYLHDDSEVAQDTFAFSVWLERKGGLEQWWREGSEEVEASFYITVTPVNDQPPLLKTVAPSLWVPRGDVVALGPDNLNVVDLDNPPEDIKYTVVQEPSNGFLALEGRLDEPILAFTQASINSGKVYFVQDGSPFSGLASLSVSDGKHRPVYTLLRLQVAEGGSPVSNRGLILEQGQSSVILTRELLAAVTNEKDANIHYQVTRPPRYGKLLMDNKVATLFDQEDLWLGKLSYHMVDLSSPHDSFEFTAFMSGQNMTEQSVNIKVKPLIRLGAGLRIPNGIAVKLGKDFLDATVLAVLSGSDPQFEILPPPKRSKVVHALIAKNGASRSITSFSFKDVEQGRLTITVTTNLAGVQELNGSIPFILKADNVQPARGELLFTVVPNDSARAKTAATVVPVQILRSPVLNYTKGGLLHNTSDPRRPPKRFNGLNERNRWGSHNRSVALLRNIPRATWSMRNVTQSNTTLRAESFPRQSSNTLIIVLPVLAFLLLTITLVVLTLVSCYHSKKQTAISQNHSNNVSPGGSDPGQPETSVGPPSVICPTLTLSSPDSPILGRPGGVTLDPIADLKDPSLLLCGLDHESAQLCLAASSARQLKQYWL